MKVGIIGAGQLARMLAMAANNLGVNCLCSASSLTDSASPVATLWLPANDWKPFAESVDVVTLENENTDLLLAETIHSYRPLRPGTKALQMSQDRLLEKQGLSALHIPVAPFHAVNSLQDLQQSVKAVGLPAILKTRRLGYDGKGQYKLTQQSDIEKAWKLLGKSPLILEGFIDFQAEVSIIAVRSVKGGSVFYPLTQNWHRDGILRLSKAPFNHTQLQKTAQDYAIRLLNEIDYVGVLAIEFFVTKKGLIANEFAPRVHNTGHWTIEGAETSQFENHIRAVCGLPLGSTALIQPSVMINCIGAMPAIHEILSFPNTHYHDYQKSARAGRKVGHITIRDNNVEAYRTLIHRLSSFSIGELIE